jgi:hypothetical protein
VDTSLAQSIKLSLMSLVSLSKDALHIYVGLTVFLVVALILRKPLRSPLPWLAVLVVAVLGEIVDIHDNLQRLGVWGIRGSIHDILNTLFWPTVLLLLDRLRVFPR